MKLPNQIVENKQARIAEHCRGKEKYGKTMEFPRTYTPGGGLIFFSIAKIDP
jgi:hypothetical protein